MNTILTGTLSLLGSGTVTQNTIGTSFNFLDANFVSLVFSLIGIFLGLIMGIATYLISSSAPQVGKIEDMEEENIYRKTLTDLDTLAKIKGAVHKWLLWIYIGVVTLPIILVGLYIGKLEEYFIYMLFISIGIYIFLFGYVARAICKIIELNITLDGHQRKSLQKRFDKILKKNDTENKKN